jgi:hypothetical protein
VHVVLRCGQHALEQGGGCTTSVVLEGVVRSCFFMIRSVICSTHSLFQPTDARHTAPTRQRQRGRADAGAAQGGQPPDGLDTSGNIAKDEGCSAEVYKLELMCCRACVIVPIDRSCAWMAVISLGSAYGSLSV